MKEISSQIYSILMHLKFLEQNVFDSGGQTSTEPLMDSGCVLLFYVRKIKDVLEKKSLELMRQNGWSALCCVYDLG